MINTALMMILVIGIGSIPFTMWNANAEGVPRVDEWIYSLIFVYCISFGSATIFYGGMYSAFDPPIAPKLHFGWDRTWKSRLPVGVSSSALLCITVLLGPLALGESPHFFFVDSAMFIVGFSIFLILGEIASKWSTGDKAPVRQSVRRFSQSVLLLRDNEGEVLVSDVNDRVPTLRPSPPCLLLSLSGSPCPCHLGADSN